MRGKRNGLSELQCRILAVLEEAGEDHVSAICNTVQRCHGDAMEIENLEAALCGLVKRGFVEAGMQRDQMTTHWMKSSTEESFKELSRLSIYLKWSDDDGLWKFKTASNHIDVLLTDTGVDLSRKILSEYGWHLAEPE